MELAADAYPWLADAPEAFGHPFRDNIIQLVQTYGFKTEGITGLQGKAFAWVIPLQSNSGTVLLHIYEQQLADDSNPSCDNCRHAGMDWVLRRSAARLAAYCMQRALPWVLFYLVTSRSLVERTCCNCVPRCNLHVQASLLTDLGPLQMSADLTAAGSLSAHFILLYSPVPSLPCTILLCRAHPASFIHNFCTFLLSFSKIRLSIPPMQAGSTTR